MSQFVEGEEPMLFHTRHGRVYTDAQIMAVKQAAIEEVRHLSDNTLKELERTRGLLSLAESFIPLSRKWEYEMLKEPPSYGGTDD